MRVRHFGRRGLAFAALAFAFAQAPFCKAASGSGPGAGAPAPERQYVVLSKSEVLLFPICSATDTASVNDETNMTTFAATLKALHSHDHPDNQGWTLLTLGTDQNSKQGEFQLGKQYSLAIKMPNGKPEPDCLDQPMTIDTTPAVIYIPNQNANEGGKFESLAAFSLPGSDKAVNFVAPDCVHPVTGATCIDIVVELHGAQIHVRKIQVMEIDRASLASGEIESADSIGRIGVNSVPLRASLRATEPNDKDGGSFVNLSNVLIGGSGTALPFTEGKLTARKAPATEDLAWLWINGTVTAGTGTAPAWVLDGKIESPSKQFNPARQFFSAVLLNWANATANVGNNKINGQTAKDVIDFSGLSTSWFHEESSVVTVVSIAPTYETNLELSHRNFLTVGDLVPGWRALEQTQVVRIAQKYFAGRDKNPRWKLPDQGNVKCLRDAFCPPKAGWSLTPHVGFEAGGALATTTVTNPKTKATIGILPTYSIARFVPQIDGLYQYRNFSVESYITGRYLFTTEHTAVNNNAGIPYLETVSGWKAVNVLTFTYSPGASPHIKFNVAYTEGFCAPTYQRANGVKIGLAIAY